MHRKNGGGRILMTMLGVAMAAAYPARAAVDWGLHGPGDGAAFRRIFEGQTASRAKTGAAADSAALRFHIGRASAFARTLALDFDSLHPYGYYLVKRGGDVLFAGKTAKGDSYAATDFLKRFTGYREFGGEFGRVMPPVESLEAMKLPEHFTYREEPDVPSYRLAWCVGSEAFSRSDRLTCMSTHAMDKMVTPDLYAEHPEYFPLVNGVRVKPGDANRPWNPCMSNPDLPELFRAYAARFFEQNPDALGIPMGVNDGGGDCNCDGCRAILARHGNQYVEFYNAAAHILAETHPGKLLAFIAYSRRCSRAPKPDFRFADNVLVEVTGSANNFDDWKACGVKHFGAYEYLYQTGFTRIAPACYTHVIAERLRKLARDYNLTTFWEESFAATSVFDGGRQYVTDELLWHLDADEEALLADYHTSLYGPAAGAMRRFADIAEEAFRDNPERRVFFSEYCNPIQFNGYTFARIAAMDQALAEAAKLAPPDSREARRVALVSSVWGLARLYADNWACSRELAKTDDPARIIELVERGMRDVAAIADYTIPREDVREIFTGDADKAYAKWKNQSGLAPLPPLERAADAAFARIARRLGPKQARAFFRAHADSPYAGVYAATQLYLLDHTPVNLVPNGSFESRWDEKPGQAAQSDWQPLGQRGWNWWKFPSSLARVWTDDTEAHSGKYSVALGESQISSCLLALWRVEPNARYRLSFWAKRNDDNRGGKLGELNVRLKNGQGAWIDDGSAIRCEIARESVGRWVRHELIFTTPDRTDGVSVHPMFMPPSSQQAGSILWIDDVALEKVCELPPGRIGQVDYARDTLCNWLRGWSVAFPRLVRDASAGPGAFTAVQGVAGAPCELRGDEEGLRIGLYAWAQAQGVRWFSPAEAPVVPPAPEAIDVSFWGTHRPSFAYRGLHTCGAHGHFYPVVAHWMSFNGMNRRLDTLKEARDGRAKYAKYGLKSDTCVHSFDTLVPESKYFARHPEYFACVGGKRLATGGQRCLANAGFRAAFAAELAHWMAEVPDAASYGICPNDGFGWCECDACRALDTSADRRDGTVNGRVAAFVADMCARFPRQTIANYSYSIFRDFYRQYPQLPSNLLLSATVSHCQRHPLADGACPRNGQTWARLEALAAARAKFYVYDYYTYLWDGLPAPMWQTVAADLKALRRIGCEGFLTEVNDEAHDSWEGFGPALYVTARLLWDVTQTADAIIADWCRARYGAAAPEMIKYFKAWEKGMAGEACFNKKPEEFARIFQPGAETHLAAAVARAPDNAFVRKSQRLYAGWKANLAARARWPVVREVALGPELAPVPVHFVRTSTQLADEKNPTSVEMALTAQAVKVRFTLTETRPAHVKRVTGDLTAGDSVELFFKDGCSAGTCYHFVVDTRGQVMASKCTGADWNWNWPHGAVFKTAKSAKGWTVEGTIPLADLNLAPGKPIAFSFVRNRYAGGKWETFGVPAGGAYFTIEDYVTGTPQ